MQRRIYKQLKELDISGNIFWERNIRKEIRIIENFRQELWPLKDYQELILYVRKFISSELSRKLEHVINPPKAMGMAEDISLDSIKWFVEYWWSRQDKKSPDLAAAHDNTVVAYWHEGNKFIKIRFLSNGFALALVKHNTSERRDKDTLLAMGVRQLPVRFN